MPTRRRRLGAGLATVALLPALVGMTATTAAATPTADPEPEPVVPLDLPEDFSLSDEDGETVLVWDGEEVVMGGAQPEFRLGEEVLGSAREIDGGLHLPLDRVPTDDLDRLDELEVWSDGRRLDAPADDAARVPDRAAPRAQQQAEPVDLDPGAPGPFATERLSYDLDPLTVDLFPAAVEVLAEVTRPVDAPGERPLVVFLHGRTSTCFSGGPDGETQGGWPCPEGFEPLPSYLGFGYLTDVLASQGYITVSVSANAINGQDFQVSDSGTGARSTLIRHHLDLWAEWTATGSDPWGGLFEDGVDLDRVALVGHSRGGEGAHRAAIDTSDDDPYRIRGVATYGPTAFSRQVTPDVHAMTVLPTCDGDVSSLQGQAYVDEGRALTSSPALRSALVVVGANHNFFNTEWTPGLSAAPARDDWRRSDDPVCGTAGSERLTAAEQRTVATQYTTALVHLALDSDEELLPLLDGTPVKPAAVGDTEIAVSAVGGDAEPLYRPGLRDEDPVLDAGMSGGECVGYLFTANPTGVCGGGVSSPHWVVPPGGFTRPAPKALELSWSAEGARAELPVSADLSDRDHLAVRVANDPGSDPAGLSVQVTDADGDTAVLPASVDEVDGWPGDGFLDRLHARTVQADLDGLAASDVDASRVTAVEIVATSTEGRVWLFDVAATRQRLVEPTNLDLPRVSVASVTEDEGSDVRTIEVPITVEEPLPAPAELWVDVNEFLGDAAPPSEPPEDFRLKLPAGASGVVETISLPVAGDDLFTGRNFDLNAGRITIFAESGAAVTGQHVGGVTLVEDDPVPVLGAVAAGVTAAEGDSLQWTLTLSAPSAGGPLLVNAEPLASGGDELFSDDIDSAFIEAAANSFGFAAEDFVPGGQPLPLSEVGLDAFGLGLPFVVRFDAGQLELPIEIPIVDDDVTEGAEEVQFRVRDVTGRGPRLPDSDLTLTGVVPASD